MNDNEFIELLNLYVDREITSEDARRLEAEVETNAARRRVYDQYCKIQKACSMLSVESLAAEGVSVEHRAPSFGAPTHWLSPLVAALAAAACVVVILNHRSRANDPAEAAPASSIAKDVSKAAASLDSTDLASDTDGMRPVFFAHQAPVQANTKRVFLANSGNPVTQLNWIGDMHLSPVFNSGDAHFLQAPRADLKATELGDIQSNRDLQEPSEMAAFRFQR